MKRKRRLMFLCVGLCVVFLVCIASLLTYQAFSHPSQVARKGFALTPSVPTATPVVNAPMLRLPPLPTKSVQTPHKPVSATPVPTPQSGVTTDSNAGWTLLYSDDFNGTQLSSTWGKYSGPHGGGKSYYDPSEVTVSNGMLHIGVERKTTGGLPITSGGLAAFGLAQIYGKYEFSARLPYGKGIDPYTILWPNAAQPNSAQVDLFESPPVDKSTLYTTNHAVDGTSSQVQAHGNFAAAFHTFTYEWTPGRIRFLVDGVDQGSLTQNVPNFSMWFGMAISSGDAFTGVPDPTTVFPVYMDVDWVRIYKYAG